MDVTRMSLLYANRTEEDILLKPELDRLAEESVGRLQVHYAVDHKVCTRYHCIFCFKANILTKPETGGDPSVEELVWAPMIEKYIGPSEPQKYVLVCGPPVMEAYVKSILLNLGYDEKHFFTFTQAQLESDAAAFAATKPDTTRGKHDFDFDVLGV